MITKTITVREGEYLGPVPDDYDYEANCASKYPCMSKEQRDKFIAADIKRFKILMQDPNEWLASSYGGIPRIYQEVIQVGMYDGWPYWKPTASFALRTGLGGTEWYAFHRLTNIMRKDNHGWVE